MTATSDRPRGGTSGPTPAASDSKSLSASVRKGGLWVVASNILLRLANVMLTAFVARILSPREFGVFAVALTAYAIVSSLGELGLSACLIRADLDIDSLAPTIAAVAVLSGAMLAAAMAASASPIATALGSAAAIGPIRILSLAVLLLGIFAVPTSQMTRDFKQDKVFLANVIGFIPSTALLVILAKSGDGATAFAWSMVARQFVTGCVLTVAAPRYYRPGLARSAMSVVLKFGIPLAVANSINYILLNVDYALVGHLLGASLLGVYMLGFTVASWPNGVLGGVLNTVSMPAFSRVKHHPALLEKGIATAVRAVSLIIMPMSAMMMVLARPLVLTMYGAKWAGSASVLVVLSLYGAVFMLCLLFANMLTGLGRTKLLLALQLIWIGALMPAMALGVHQDGVVGAAYAHVAVIVPIVLPSHMLALKRVTGVRLTTLGKAALPAILAAAAAALAGRAAASQLNRPLAQLITGLAVGGLVYFICIGKQAIALFGRGRVVERGHPPGPVTRPRWGEQYSFRVGQSVPKLGEPSLRGASWAGGNRGRPGRHRRTPGLRRPLLARSEQTAAVPHSSTPQEHRPARDVLHAQQQGTMVAAPPVMEIPRILKKIAAVLICQGFLTSRPTSSVQFKLTRKEID